MTQYELQELEALKADITKLGSDLVALTEKLTEIGKDGVGAAREELEGKVRNFREKLHQIFEDTRSRGQNTAKTLQQQIHDRTLMSLLVATGVGFLLGILVTWRIKGRDSD